MKKLYTVLIFSVFLLGYNLSKLSGVIEAGGTMWGESSYMYALGLLKDTLLLASVIFFMFGKSVAKVLIIATTVIWVPSVIWEFVSDESIKLFEIIFVFIEIALAFVALWAVYYLLPLVKEVRREKASNNTLKFVPAKNPPPPDA